MKGVPFTSEIINDEKDYMTMIKKIKSCRNFELSSLNEKKVIQGIIYYDNKPYDPLVHALEGVMTHEKYRFMIASNNMKGFYAVRKTALGDITASLCHFFKALYKTSVDIK